MQSTILYAAICALFSAGQIDAQLTLGLYSNTTTTATAGTSLQNTDQGSATQPIVPATTFGAAAAMIQSAIAQGQAQQAAASTSATIDSIVATTTTTTTTTTSTATSTTAISTIRPIVVVNSPSVVVTTTTTATNSPAAPQTTTHTKVQKTGGASVGSQGTTTIDGQAYTTVVVASYTTVAASPTTIYENGIAYVASYAGETLTVTDCPCTRSARIAIMTTTVCSACVSGVPVSVTSSSGPSVATSGDTTVVFTGSSGRVSVGGWRSCVLVAVLAGGLLL